MLLLSDGTVMAASRVNDTGDGSSGSRIWYRLTPDVHGSYLNGSWTTLESMRDNRLWYSSAVLRDGRVFVAGGEYPTGGAGSFSGEVYDPNTGHWSYTPPPGVSLVDSVSKLLPNGNVLVAPASGGITLIYNTALNTWSAGPTPLNPANQNEVTWLKLPDDSILTVPTSTRNSQRFITASNQWVVDGVLPVSLYTAIGSECGGAFLLANGKAIFLGGTSQTALYTPTGNNTPGSWVAGPNFLGNAQGAPDAGACMMVNGRILCAVSATITAANPNGNAIFPIGVTFQEYDPVANSFANVASPTGGAEPIPSFQALMLALPDGNVLYSNFGDQLYIYTPDPVSPLEAGKPTISSITANGDGSFHLTGTKLNGISEGASYGDDAQMDSNYPLVRLRDDRGQVFYARTYNWSSTGVQTGSKLVSTEFFAFQDLEPALPYSLVAVANGISSDPVTFYGPVWVDLNDPFPFQLGTFDFPYHTLAQGTNAVPSTGTINFKTAGSIPLPLPLNISKPMTIVAVGGPVTIGQ